jgi:hypothetical protein
MLAARGFLSLRRHWLNDTGLRASARTALTKSGLPGSTGNDSMWIWLENTHPCVRGS